MHQTIVNDTPGEPTMRSDQLRYRPLVLFSLALTLGTYPARRGVAADERERVSTPNYQQAAQYSSQYVRQFLYDTQVTPHWIGKTDQFWYSFRTSQGTNYYRVNPRLKTKEPLFDRGKLGAALSEMVQKPLDPAQLPLERTALSDDGAKLKFVTDGFEYEYDLTAEKLTKLGKAPPAPAIPTRGLGSREDFERFRDEQRRRREQDDQRRDQQEEVQRQDQHQQQVDQQRQEQDNQQRGNRGGAVAGRGRPADYRNFSPDRTAYVFVKGHNLYLVELKPEETKKADDAKASGKRVTPPKDAHPPETKKDEKQASKKDEKQASGQEAVTKTSQESRQQTGTQTQTAQSAAAQSAGATSSAPALPRIDPKLDEKAIQLSTDGTEDYTFAAGFGAFGFRRGTEGTGQETAVPPNPDRKTRPNVTWSSDSKAFFVTRADARGVQELWVINSLAQPRPAIEKYKYPMPGEEKVRKTELHYFRRDAKKLVRVTPKWRDEGYSNVHWGKAAEELRFIRHDRLLRHVELCGLDTATGKSNCLLTEGFENADVATQSVHYLDESNEMIWWSERTGWGHFYLYDRNGTLKNAITSGPFRASRIVDVDPRNRLLYFLANGREPGENPYFEHLYCVHLDGTGLVLMDPGNANHRSVLSPSKQFVVDTCARVDMAPVSCLRAANGQPMMQLETADLTRLGEVGWRKPETFVVKAADGITDLYGNLWKPFDFDPKKKYPIIAHVYPGPQMEGTTHAFSATAGEQQLAQLGFIVIQVGHRGGAPNRSKAYASYGYFNLRDYGLADKKAAIEQLAARFSYIDLDRVGIYGHSGGGFMTAAAMLQTPYNEFFKVGVATSGNHDNNVYNSGWSERYHGLKEVDASTEDATQDATRGGRGRTQGRRGQGGQLERGGSRRDVRADADAAADEVTDTEAGDDTDAVPLGETTLPRSSADTSDEDGAAQSVSKDGAKTETDQKADAKKDAKQDAVQKTEAQKKEMKFSIHVPTNAELAANLKGYLMLIHGELDNNVHPANTLRLVDALIKANKRFDMLYLPGKRHAYGDYQPYVNQRIYEYFAEHLMGNHQSSADIMEKPRPEHGR